MFGLGPLELISIFVIGLIIFGPNKLPEVAKSIAKGVNTLRKAANSINEEIRNATDLDDLETKTKKTV